MRKSTLLFTLFGFALYLVGILSGSVITYRSSDFPILSTSTSEDISTQVTYLEPDHEMVIQFLVSPGTFPENDPVMTIYLAKEYLAIGQTEPAIKLLTKAAQTTSTDLSGIQLLAEVYHHSQQYQQEQALLVSSLADHSDVWITRRLILLNAVLGVPNSSARIAYVPFDPADPYAQILNAGTIEPPPQRVRIIVANLLRLGETALAQHLAQTSIQKVPIDPLELPILAYIYAANGDKVKAKNLLDGINASGMAGISDADTALIASAYELVGDKEMAIALYTKKLTADPLNDVWHRYLLRLTSPSQPTAAVTEYMTMIERSPSIENLSALIDLCIDFPAYRDPSGNFAAEMLAGYNDLAAGTRILLARFAIAGGEYSKAIGLLDPVIIESSDEQSSVTARYMRATALLASQSAPSEMAASDLLLVIHQYPPNPFAASAEALYRSNFR